MESNGFDIISTIPFQRYGLENHVSWLKNKLPGGDGIIQKLLKNIDNNHYCKALEDMGMTDTVIMVAKKSHND